MILFNLLISGGTSQMLEPVQRRIPKADTYMNNEAYQNEFTY